MNFASLSAARPGLSLPIPPRWRPLLPVALWVLLLAFQLFLYVRLGAQRDVVMAAMVAKDFVASVLGFYFFSRVVLPRFVVQRRWLLTGAGLLAIYYGWALLSHLTYATLVHLGIPLGDWHPYMHRTLDAGLGRGVFGWYGVSQSLSDFIVIPMQPILLRFLWFLLVSSNRSLQLQRENLRLEISTLKAQVNPHFLFNTLNNLYLLVVKQDARAPDMVQHLAQLMHYTVYESDATLVPLAEEVRFLESYLELERLRYGPKVSIRYAAPAPAELAPYRLTPLLFFSFVENAFKHGVDSSLEASWVDIRLAVVAGWLHFEVGNSFSPAAPKRAVGGVGLANVRQRLALHYAPAAYQLDLTHDPDTLTYRVTLRLRLTPATAPPASLPLPAFAR